MILRWTVEGKFAATFTSSKKVVDRGEAVKIIMALGWENYREKYAKNAHPILYDDNNKVIERMKIIIPPVA